MSSSAETANVLVGRLREIAELCAALDSTVAGQGRLVMLAGEPGIGKTRMAQGLASYAESQGAQVLWGWCYEEEGAPPYWPWLEPIQSYANKCDPQQLQEEMGAGAAEIAEVVPVVSQKLPGLESLPAMEPEQARFRLFDSIAAFFKKVSAAKPTVIVLEDLHSADRSSLLLLEFLARQIGSSRILLVGTYRDVEVTRHHPLSQTLGNLIREEVFVKIQLDRLTKQAVGQFVEFNSGIKLADNIIEIVHNRTEGNPLFLGELMRLLSRDELLGSEEWARTLPESIRDVIGRRLSRLSQECNQTLIVASVIGREFGLDPLSRVLDDQSESGDDRTTGNRLLEVLEEALAARVIEELPHLLGRYQFTHALIQETLREEVSLTRKARLHAIIAEAIEDIYTADIELHASELIYHLGEAAPYAGTGKLTHYCIMAGEQALATHGHEEALFYFERGLATKIGQPVDTETATLWFGLGRAQAATLEEHQIEEALNNLKRAFDFYFNAGDTVHAITLAKFPLTILPGHATGMAQLIARALTLVEPDSLEAGRLQCRYGAFTGIEEGDYEGAHAAFRSALAIAERENDAVLQVSALANACRVDIYHLHIHQSLEHGLKAIELARRSDDLYAEVEARYWATLTLTYLGDPVAARLQSAAALAVAVQLRDRFWVASACWCSEIVPRIEGDWQVAREFSERGLAASPTEPRLLATRALIECEVGSFDESDAHVERLLEAMGMVPVGATVEYALSSLVIPLVARVTGSADRLSIAQRAAESVLSSPYATPHFSLLAKTGLAFLAVLDGDPVKAEEHYGALEPQRGTMMHGATIAVDRVLGLLAVTMGRGDQAKNHFEDALTFCARAGYRPEHAWSASDYAEALLRTQDSSDHNKAKALLEEAQSLCHELGMRPLAERVADLQTKAQFLSAGFRPAN